MHLRLSEEEQNHLYSCLLVGNSEFQKIKKSLAKLNREDDKVDDEIALNAALRKTLNPRAEEEAREAERKKKDPAQIDLTEQIASSGETGGGHPAGETVTLKLVGSEDIPPTNEVLRDTLIECDRFVLLSDIRAWTSSERDAAVRFAREAVMTDLDTYADEPECVATVALSRERIEQLEKAGPYATREVFGPDDSEEPVSVKIVVPSDDDEPDVEEGEYVDPVEAEIKCARLNRDYIKNADMDPSQAGKWLGAGPWTIVAEPVEGSDSERVDRWYVVLPSEGTKERASSQDDAGLTAARYNRSVAGRDEEGNWREPPVRLTEDAVQEIHAAAEAD